MDILARRRKPTQPKTYRLIRVVRLCMWLPVAILTAPVGSKEGTIKDTRGKVRTERKGV